MFLVSSKTVTSNFLLQRSRKLKFGWTKVGGRNTFGVITSYKKGSYKYHRVYRFIDFWRRLASDAFIVSFEKDNFRSSTLTLIFYQTGYLSYIILPEGYNVGDKLKFTLRPEHNMTDSIFPGNAVSLEFIPEGSFIFNIELWPLKGAQLCRAAGTYGVIVSKWNGFVTVKLRSGWKVVLSNKCYATIGISPNYKHAYKVLRKAGLRVNLGRRPTVRGVAMNAIDHPHGGGRGKTSGGPKPRTPWGKITKQQKTVSKKLRLSKSLVRFR